MYLKSTKYWVQEIVNRKHSVYASLNRHKFILFGTNLCHFGVNQYQVGMKSYHRTMESGVQKFSKKFSEELDDQMWNNFFNISIISSAVDQKVWKSLFVWSNQVWIYTTLVWIHSSLVYFHAKRCYRHHRIVWIMKGLYNRKTAPIYVKVLLLHLEICANFWKSICNDNDRIMGTA